MAKRGMSKTLFESALKDPGQLAKMLLEHDKWRRGIGKYRWHEKPSKNVDMPFLPSELTLILNATIGMLKRIDKNQKKASKK